MYSTLSVDGDHAQFLDDDARIALTFACGDLTHRCAACGEDLVETLYGHESDVTGPTCPGRDSDHGTDQPHQPERVPLSWANSAAIVADDDQDAVTVAISVGDPRGAFCFTVRRVPDDADSDLAGRLVLHMPYPGESLPHAPLTQLHPGTFLIG